MLISFENIKPNKPEPIPIDIDLIGLNRRMELQRAVNAILDGEYILIKDYYSTGLSLLEAIKKHLNSKYNDLDFLGQRDFRAIYRAASQRLLVRVQNQQLTIRKAPFIGWLKYFYSEYPDFLLSFPDIQGLNSSWQWYEKGIKIPEIKHRIHPFYGTYFPTRFEHLKLFANWLKTYSNAKKSAIDIGVGCGVLSFLLIENGFEKVYATDINKNAILSVSEELKRINLVDKIYLFCGDLFEGIDIKSELILFNPPWLPSKGNNTVLDKAIYYEEDLFTKFFEQAYQHLEKNGKIVIVFSNLAQKVGFCSLHPIAQELAQGGRFKKDILLKKNVNEASKKTKRNQTWRKEEFVELWVLSAI